MPLSTLSDDDVDLDVVPARPRLTRRRFLLGGLIGGLGAASITGAAAYDARYVQPYSPRLERLELPLPVGHKDLAGLRLAFVTDTHVGPFITPDDLARATALLAPERPDVVLLGGDYISETSRYAGPAAEVLGELARAAPLGGYAVLGNHDIYNRPRVVTAALQDAGIAVLRNESARIETARGNLWLAGIDDAVLGYADPDAAFAGIPDGAAILALWHEPDGAEASAARGAFA